MIGYVPRIGKVVPCHRMVKSISHNEEQLFEELVARGQNELVTDKEAYDDMVEALLEEHTDLGEMNIDEDEEGMEDHLKARFEDYRARIAE